MSGGEASRAVARFVRALWGVEVRVEAGSPATEPRLARPRFDGALVRIPASPRVPQGVNHEDYWWAVAAHIGAHLRFGGEPFTAQRLKPIQIAVISLLEDARVEHLAAAQFPGLRKLWSQFHAAPSEGPATAAALFARLARALQGEDSVEVNTWVCKARQAFFARRSEWQSSDFCRQLGGLLGNDLGQMRVQFNAKDWLVEPAYRDDHQGLWCFEAGRVEEERTADDGQRAQGQEPRSDVGNSPAPGGQATFTARQRLVHAAGHVDAPFRYPEWDYAISRERSDFCALRETAASLGDPQAIDAALERHADVRRRFSRAARGFQLRSPRLERRLLDGDRIDLSATVAAVAARGATGARDDHVYRSCRAVPQATAVLVLMDLSESLNDATAPGEPSALELARSVSALLIDALANAQTQVAVHGFSSAGRHDVTYFRISDFGSRLDPQTKGALAGLRAERSTRLGVALRHAGRLLGQVRAERKLLLVLTDGEPSDIDVHDDSYLRHDARRAAWTNRARGITTWSLGLNGASEASLRAVFGAQHFALTERIDVLPQRLSALFKTQ